MSGVTVRVRVCGVVLVRSRKVRSSSAVMWHSIQMPSGVGEGDVGDGVETPSKEVGDVGVVTPSVAFLFSGR